MIHFKLLGGLLGGVVAVAGIGGMAYAITNNGESGTWRNYLVQVLNDSSQPTKDDKTCVFGKTCKFFTRNEVQNQSDSSANLTQIEDFSRLVKDQVLVLTLKNLSLNGNEEIKVSSSDSNNTFINLKVMAKTPVNLTSFKMPKPPKKFVPKKRWIGPLNITFTQTDDVETLENKKFFNESYPTHINRKGIDHTSYMVIKWQKTLKDSKNSGDDVPHDNFANFLYLLKESASQDNQDTIPIALPSNLYPVYIKTKTIKKYDAIESFLFKPTEEQKEEKSDTGSIKITVANPDGYFRNFANIHVEIYEISDQSNIQKAFPLDSSTTAKPEEVDWSLIDKDSKMITKLLEMEHDKYYKFVFSNNEVIKDGLSQDWKQMGASFDTTNTSMNFPIFTFNGKNQDFYCLRSKETSTNKCAFFKKINT